jgi:FkbM family methyltransferase
VVRIPSSVKRRLRPVVFSTRQVRRQVGRILRPPRPWNGCHHPALSRFEPWEGEADGRFCYDFLGTKTDPAFRLQFKPDPPGPLRTEHPYPSYSYFELAFVLESVLTGVDANPFRVMELGAGYGPWLVTAHQAMERLGGGPTKLVGVEMVPQYHRWMIQHLRNNGIDPRHHRLINAAVSDYEGQAVFDQELSCDVDYGQSIRRRRPTGGRDAKVRTRSSDAADHGVDQGSISVPCVSLRRLLRECDHVDLLHLDVQGEELRVLRHALGELDQRVGRLLVATHSRRTHRALRRLLGDSGWHSVHDYRLRTRERTAFGDVQFLDGLLAYVNPRCEQVHPIAGKQE